MAGQSLIPRIKQLITGAGKPGFSATTPNERSVILTLLPQPKAACSSESPPNYQQKNRFRDKKYQFIFAVNQETWLHLRDTEQVVIRAFFYLHTYLLNLFPAMKTFNVKDSTRVKTAFDVFSKRFQNNDIALIVSCNTVKFPGGSVPVFCPQS